MCKHHNQFTSPNSSEDAALATSPIDELQLDASNVAVSVSSLLRKALMVSSKLELSDIPDWINKELSGYVDGDSLPSYRTVHGQVKARTLGGWVPVQCLNSDAKCKNKFQRAPLLIPLPK